jgi:lysophospholipase L1-like esterase
MVRGVFGSLMLLCVSCVPNGVAPRELASESFELRNGDRVVLIGNTFIEREQNYSYLETLLRMHWPDRKVTFRNLGWSGDTVFGESRAIYGELKGPDRLVALVHELKPTVILIGYGEVESYQGEAGLERFRVGLNQLLDKLEDLHAQIVLLGPTKHEGDAAAHNPTLRIYANAIRTVALQRGLVFVNLFEQTGEGLTENGVHLTQRGYWRAADAIAEGLGVSGTNPLPSPGHVINAPMSQKAERVRELSVLKNIQFFNQFRPANEPYIFGFRKAEQSRNRVELLQFTQSIEQLEVEIHQVLKSK